VSGLARFFEDMALVLRVVCESFFGPVFGAEAFLGPDFEAALGALIAFGAALALAVGYILKVSHALTKVVKSITAGLPKSEPSPSSKIEVSTEVSMMARNTRVS